MQALPHLCGFYPGICLATEEKAQDGEMAYAKCRSPFPWLEGNQMTTTLTNIIGITSKSKHTVKYRDFPSAMRPVQHSEESVPNPPENLLAMTTLVLMKITDSKKGTMLIVIRHLKQVVHHLNPDY
jgi:hypothetical protein